MAMVTSIQTDRFSVGTGRTGRTRHALLFGLLSLLGLWLGQVTPAQAVSKCPTLTILLDQSASMQQDPTGLLLPATSDKHKFAIARQALTLLNNKYTGLLPIGYSNFPSQDSSCLTSGAKIPPGYGNQVAINNAMIAYPFPGGSTPTCDAIKKLAADPSMVDPARKHYVLLLTDGAPAVDCCPGDPVKATVDAIHNAAIQSPSITTIVVGFGSLSAAERDAMNQMAVAGGLPDNSDPMYKYYRADSYESLDAALAKILKFIAGGDAGASVTCEDGCYGTGCPSGQVCQGNACKPNLCASKTCPSGQSCLSDGKTASCVSPCLVSCPAGARCQKGQCVSDVCSGLCVAGEVCNKASGKCEVDPACAAVLCHSTQGCFGGTCVDDPCVYLTCPSGYSCRPFDGSCEVPAGTPPPAAATGCEVAMGAPSQANRLAGLSGLALWAGLAMVALRRRRVSSQVRQQQA